ncbi:MAG: LppX_LprAFG lipoprotein [Ilumatobacter sp.]
MADQQNTGAAEHARRRPFLAAILCGIVTLTACGSDGVSEPTEPLLPPDADVILSASAAAMGNTDSVRFTLTASGSPVYIDEFEEIALTSAVGVFKVPGAAQAVLDVVVSGNLNTQLGAVALDDEVWLSNPITGQFETLPPGYDLDPSRFFDPRGGWQPLMANLTDATLIGLVERDGQNRYHVTATAPADRIAIITAGLVRGQDVDIEFWIQPVTGNVRVAEFTTATPEGDVEWLLELDDFGADVEIIPPEGVQR